MISRIKKIDSFNLKPGRILLGKYEVLGKLGEGTEGEAYHVREIETGITRAAKIFYPHKNIKGKTTRFVAQKLHKLRHCPIIIQYFTQEKISFHKEKITALISEFVEGEQLSQYIKRRRRLPLYEALHLLHALAKGVARIHDHKEYHGDIHDENIMVLRRGIWWDIELLDLYNHGRATKQLIADDVVDLVRVLYDMLGGRKYYAQQPRVVKNICCGLKRNIINNKFPTAHALVAFMDSFDWEE